MSAWSLLVPGLLLLAWALAVALGTGVVLGRAWRFWRPIASHPGAAVVRDQPALLVRPCAGAEARLLDNLASAAQARHSFPLTVALTVADAADTALPVAEQARATLEAAGLPCSVAIHPPLGPNRKASQLAGALRHDHGRHPIVISADSDVDLSRIDLDRLIAPLQDDPALGAVWAPFIERPAGRRLGDRAGAALLDGSLHAFALLCAVDGKTLVGKLCAFRPAHVGAVGGWEGLVHHLGEDVELAQRLAERGLGVCAVPLLAEARGEARSFGAALQRLTRWLSVVRWQRPRLLWSYPALLLAPWLLALGVLALWGSRTPPLALAILLLVALSRLATATVARALVRRAGGGVGRWPGALLDAVLADALLALAFLRAIGGRRVSWRGHTLELERGGRLRRAV
ncbi:MAG: glycosyltransferase [Proteobacteria bacterium]|nr:glycosyltransferase [Pseudomonadota bacterium]